MGKNVEQKGGSFRAKSIKTRIETLLLFALYLLWPRVLEQNPSKQGLKPMGTGILSSLMFGFRAKSIKTRIETLGSQANVIENQKVLEQNPSKQGLKQFCKSKSRLLSCEF